jgi:ABC-type transporter Mla maintaining outer membrane lipid asymmetry ATPase subunit MlaF
MIADQAIMLHGGKVIAAGTLEEVQSLDHPQVRAFFDRRPRPTTVQRGLLEALLVNGESNGKNKT